MSFLEPHKDEELKHYYSSLICITITRKTPGVGQWLNGRAFDSRSKGCRFKSCLPQFPFCIDLVMLEDGWLSLTGVRVVVTK